MSLKVCPDCQTAFTCRADESGQRCWCLDLPPLMPLEMEPGCYCPACLKQRIQAKVEAFCRAIRPETALTSGAQKYARPGPLIEDLDYYLNEEGKFVLTAWYLLKRGHCCQNGCRHCPYGYSKHAHRLEN